MGLGSGIRDPGSGKKPNPDAESRGQKVTGSQIRICNTVSSDSLNNRLCQSISGSDFFIDKI
jgi:hypothetical protein